MVSGHILSFIRDNNANEFFTHRHWCFWDRKTAIITVIVVKLHDTSRILLFFVAHIESMGVVDPNFIYDQIKPR